MRRPPTRVGGARSFVGLVGLLGLVGCSPGTAAPAPAPTTAAGTTAAATTTAPAPPAYVLPATCSELLTLTQVDAAIGARLPGETSYVVGEPEPGIGRTGRVSCGFGVTPATGTAGPSAPLLEVSVFTYTDPGAAADRVDVLVEAAAGQGVRSSPAAVPGADAVLLSAVGDTTLVATVGARTYALTLLPGLLDEPGTAAALARLAGDVVAADTPGPAGDTTTCPRTTGSTGTSTG